MNRLKGIEEERKIEVLVVDDDNATCLILKRFLVKQGYSVQIEGDAEGALERLEQGPCDIVLSDLRLPGKDGIELAEWVRDHHPGVDVIMMTASASVESARQALQLGVLDYILKPFKNLSFVASALQRVVDKRRLQNDLALTVEQLHVSQENFSSIVERSPNGLLVLDSQLQILYSNSTARTFLGGSFEPVRDVLLLSLCDSVGEIVELTDKHEISVFDEKGALQTLEVQVKPTLWQQQDAYLVVLRDISDRKKVEQKLRHDSRHDGLTGLANRNFFMEHLRRQLERKKRKEGYLFAVLFLDLDRFKVINDSLGHLAGDELLDQVARRLESCIRGVDIVARLGGDEFAILLEDLRYSSDATRVASRIIGEIGRPFYLKAQEVFVTVSVGIAICSKSTSLDEELMRDADTAMYRAKSEGKNQYSIFDQEMHKQALGRLRLENDLRRAIQREEFRLYYQPVISLEDRKIVGFEALIRWIHPELGFISPVDFISIAEETGQIVPLGVWVLREGCRQIKVWQDLCPQFEGLSISVNVSTKQFFDPHWFDTVEETLRETRLLPSLLNLEITESVLMENPERINPLLLELKKLGLHLHMDDFGTGYSSLSYLHRFPIDTLKIDRSFVQAMNGNHRTEIVQTIVSLALQLKMEVIAEGIETESQLEWLKQLECPRGQGYLFSPPVPPEKAVALLESSLLS